MEVDHFSSLRDEFDWDVDEVVVEEPDEGPSDARHARVRCVACQNVAQDRILRVSTDPADHVTGIDVADVDRRAFGCKELSNPLLEKDSDVGVTDIAASVAVGGTSLYQVLARTFGNNDDSVALSLEAIRQGAKKPSRPIKLEGLFRNEAVVDLTAGQRGPSRDETGIAAHQADKADAIENCAGFSVCAIYDVSGAVDRRIETKRTGDEEDVVVDGLGDANHRQIVAARTGLLQHLE